MNHIKNIILILICCSLQVGFAQTDTLIRYNPESGKMSICNTIIIDSTRIFDHTEWNYGSENGFDLLNLTPPGNTYPNAGFTDYSPAHNYYSVDHYPVRTAVKLFFIVNDSLKQKCSGILVARNYILTDCHCIGDYDSNRVFQFQDSISVSPAFDNGKENSVFGKSLGIEYITFMSNMKDYWHKDIALIKLKEEIGNKTGWVGIAFSKDDSYYGNKVFHKFSYPGVVEPAYDSTKIFNGDTLYYNYGVLDFVENDWLGYNILGIRGQSGSSLIYTDNEEYYSIGTLIFSMINQHIRITPEIFYAFKSIISSSSSNVENTKGIISSYYLSEAYPNPFNPRTKINYVLPGTCLVRLKVYDVLGREVQTLVNGVQTQGKHEITFDGSRLSSGMYMYSLQSGNYIIFKKMLLLK
jgi:hypothetical protein